MTFAQHVYQAAQHGKRKAQHHATVHVAVPAASCMLQGCGYLAREAGQHCGERPGAVPLP